MREHQDVQRYDLQRLLRKDSKNGSRNVVTRQSGQVLRERIERGIEQERVGEVVALDFTGIGVIDYCCADEIVAKLVSRLLGGEYGDRYILLIGLNEYQRENIAVALERKDLAVLAQIESGKKEVLGNLNNYLRKTLDLVVEKGNITAGELSKMLKLPANTSGTRLLNLHRKRLVRRRDDLREGGRVWVYESI